MHQTGEKVATTDYTITDGKVLLHKIYSYQNSNKGGEANATSFTIQGTYKGKTIKPISVKLQDATTTEAIDVQRNHCYRILLKPTGDDFKPIKPDDPSTAWKIVVKVLDWNEATDLGNYSDEDLDNQGNVPDPPVNLLDAVAEYNLDATGSQFTNSHSNAAGYTGYFSWAEAKALQMPKGYHLPTGYEWVAILGSNFDPFNPLVYHIRFDQNITKKDVSLTVQIPGQTGTMVCKEDIKQSAESATYMIRYKDNDTYRSAWCYSWVDGPIYGQKVLKIESVPVKDNLTIEQLNKAYFAKPGVKENVKTRYLPTVGEIVRDDEVFSRGSDTDYLAATEFRLEDGQAEVLRITERCAFVYGDSKTNRYPVRPFRDKLQ